MIREIASVEEFNEIKRNGNGYIAITDHIVKDYNGNRVHKVTCSYVKEEYFKQKVESNNGENGEYYYTDDHQEAIARFQHMSECKVCF